MSAPSTSATGFASHHFDYLVVGGGTAGLVVAARLSEDPGIKVGVLEAGPALFDEQAINVPGRYGEGIGRPFDWQYETTLQPGLRGRKLPWPRGKVLGGSSALNFMIWNRPNKEDLDAWADLGNTGWAWNDVLPFYKRSENFIEPDGSQKLKHKLFYDQESLGVGGPVSISYIKEYSASHQYWHETINAIGLTTNQAHLAGSNVGAWTSVAAVDPKTSTRSFSASAYYLPNAQRENLFVLTDASVQEILLEHRGSGWVAEGVRFIHDGHEHTAKASKEIILSAGSVASPQLLELSGIGNPSVLKPAGINVKVENKNVGEHLQDHIMTATIYEIDPSMSSPDDLKSDPVLAAVADEIYETTKGGPRIILPVSYCYAPLSEFVTPARLASLAAQATGTSPRDHALARRLQDAQRLGQIEYIFDVGNWSTFMPADPTPGKKYATMLQILQYPFSRGSIHLSPNDPQGKPVIDPQYYSGDYGALDLDVQELCAQFGQKIVDTEPLKKFIRKRVWPPADATATEIRDWIIDNTVTDWHPVATCSMGGKEGINGGVVDQRLHVYGVKGLRVVDASVMPLQVSAHLQATVYAIAEKASHMILEDRLMTNGITNGRTAS